MVVEIRRTIMQCGLFSSIALISTLSMPATAAALSDEGTADSLPARITFESAFGNDVQDYTMDVLLPLWQWPQGVFFINPRISLTDGDGSAEEFNIGLGLRREFGESAIFGVNLFYDKRSSEYDNEYGQFGIGIELLSEWVDARLNYYNPEDDRDIIGSFAQSEQRKVSRSWWEAPYASGYGIWQNKRFETTTTTTTRHYEYYEQAMEGWDAEVGAKLPLLPDWLETRVFIGGYAYQAPYGDDLTGWKGRIEIRPMRGLVFDAAVYEDQELYGADWMVGARISLPIDIERMIAGDTPFESLKQWFRPEKRTLPQRLNEMVIRDVRIHTKTWGPIENLALKQVSIDTQSSATRFSLLTDVMFVDGGRAGSVQNGTWEHPFAAVQSGVDSAFGQKNVYVNAFSGRYLENVVLTDGVQLYGSGWLISGYNGQSFGSGIKPIIDGGGNGPVITLAANNAIRGLHLVNTTPGTASVVLLPGLSILGVNSVGIFGTGSLGTTIIAGNTIDSIGDGIAITMTGGDCIIDGNEISAGTTGITLLASDGSIGTISVTDNTISAGLAGIVFGAINTNIDQAAFSGNRISGGLFAGMITLLEDSTIHDFSITANEMSGNLFGLWVITGNSTIEHATIAGNRIDALMGGMVWQAMNHSVVNDLTIVGNTISGSVIGLGIESSDSTITSALIGNNKISSEDSALEIYATGSLLNNFTISRNTFSGAGDGLTIEASGLSLLSGFVISGNTFKTDGYDFFFTVDNSVLSADISGNRIIPYLRRYASAENGGTITLFTSGSVNTTFTGFSMSWSTNSGGVINDSSLWVIH